MQNNTDSLAAMIVRSMKRNTTSVAHAQRIDGMATAWEHLTGEIATDEALFAAAARYDAALSNKSVQA